MARPDPNQYALDFESATAERRTMLLSALTLAGHKRLASLALLVFNYQERSGGAPLEWPVARYAQEFDICERTIQRRTRALEISGILTVEERVATRGGQQTNRLGVNWPRVREIAKLPRPKPSRPLSPRPAEMSPRGAILSPTLSESLSPQKFNHTTTSIPSQSQVRGTIRDGRCITTLRNPPTAPERTRAQGTEEEEVFLRRLKQELGKFPHKCRRLDHALRTALVNGFGHEALWERCQWFVRHLGDWGVDYRGGALHDGLVYASPAMDASEGWPYR